MHRFAGLCCYTPPPRGAEDARSPGWLRTWLVPLLHAADRRRPWQDEGRTEDVTMFNGWPIRKKLTLGVSLAVNRRLDPGDQRL